MLREISLFLGSIAFFAACEPSAPPATAAELATRLKSEGIEFTSTQILRLPSGNRFRFDEGIALISDNLWVELIRIEDAKVFQIARDASGILTLAEASAGRELPGKPKIYPRQPYLIIVRQEPAEGHVLRALNKILPADD